MALQAVAYFGIVLMTEDIRIQNFLLVSKSKVGKFIGYTLAACGVDFCSSQANENDKYIDHLDDDVVHEKELVRSCVLNGIINEYDLVLDEITKTYDSSFLFGNPKL
jgi:hypothetical protein